MDDVHSRYLQAVGQKVSVEHERGRGSAITEERTAPDGPQGLAESGTQKVAAPKPPVITPPINLPRQEVEALQTQLLKSAVFCEELEAQKVLLRRENARLRQENSQLKAMNGQLTKQHKEECWRAVKQAENAVVAQMEQDYKTLRDERNELKRRVVEYEREDGRMED